MGFQQGLSGLNAASKNLDVIGNNVANANTIGFKGQRAEFGDMYANSLLGSSQTIPGIGVRTAAITQQFGQGNISVTSNPLDIAINGNGFFRLENNGVVTYSRNGQFQVDKDQYLVTASGQHVTGFVADAGGSITADAPGRLRLSTTAMAPAVTTKSTIKGNFDSREDTIPNTPFNPVDSTTYNGASGMTVYDDLGNSHAVQLYFARPDPTTSDWQVYAVENGSTLNGGTAIGTLSFSNGLLSSTATTNFTVPVPAANGAGAFSFDIDFAGSTQFGASTAMTAITQDGYAPGTLAGFSIGNDGTISGRYSNGQTKAQGRIVLTDFANPQGLASLGNNQWAETTASGQPVTGTAGTGNFGTMQSAALEEANVDLTNELVNMITAQRAYQANAQTVKTMDSMLQTLVNMR
ncbi:flagellar hook protein FlgE [Derxia gummosa]|uniref:Flagellar hook protein FlgE n=1 Tax=Derxia gummosa DSM 723 TaxID=1121388 RepID=A0A8B6X6D4_9BURK|nr:flagellar hook protein FlgE [Derxia gummosa]